MPVVSLKEICSMGGGGEGGGGDGGGDGGGADGGGNEGGLCLTCRARR